MKKLFATPLPALAAGLLLRLFFIFRLPANAGDSALYETLGWNWLTHGVYGMFLHGRLTPVDLRPPGYPSFLAMIYFLSGQGGVSARLWVMLAQAGVDLLSCFLIATLALHLIPQAEGDAQRVKLRALWLAALCPFIANYSAVILTEILATFWTAAALLFFVLQLRAAGDLMIFLPPTWGRWGAFVSDNFLEVLGILGGLAVGIGTLIRPEAPILLASSGLVLGVVMIRRGETARWLRAAVLMGLGCLLPLLPWAARNAVTLHEVQFLNPRYNELPGEFVSRGFMAWESTWLDRYRYSYLVTFKLEEQPIRPEDLPAYAFDTPEEKEKVYAVLGEYNKTTEYGPREDAVFAQLARERTARHPLRTRVWIPLTRVFVLWFTPQMELLPYDSTVFPLAQEWDENGESLVITLGMFFLNIFFLLLAARGAARLWRSGSSARAVVALLAAFVVLRTAVLTTVESPDPRYVILCYPLVLALAAHAFHRNEETEPDAIAVRAVLRAA
jgi:hypothetical protein